MAWMYILECSDGSFYVGSTVNLENRVAAHAMGLGANYTKSRLPVRCVFAQEFERVDEAFEREKQVQNWGRVKRIALIEGRFGDLNQLSRKPSKKPGKE
jgi:putative endonuclease